MPALDDNLLERLRDLNTLRDRAIDLRERARKALAKIPNTVNHKKLKLDHNLSGEQWVSGSHPVDLALVVRVLNNQGLRGRDFEPCCDRFHNALREVVESLFKQSSRINTANGKDPTQETQPIRDTELTEGEYRSQSGPGRDPVPVLTAARAMHALVGKSETVFSPATMLCYYQIVRELYLATFPNWIIGAARAGEGGRVSAFVTGECVRAVLAFQNSIRDTITFFTTTRKLWEELDQLKAIPNPDTYLPGTVSHWPKCVDIEFERIALDWYAANNLRRNVIALNLSSAGQADNEKDKSQPPASPAEAAKSGSSETQVKTETRVKDLGAPVFPISGKIDQATVERTLEDLPLLLLKATREAVDNITAARDAILEFRKGEAGRLLPSDIKNLDLIVERLHENRNREYDYYLKALSEKTSDYLKEYMATRAPGNTAEAGRSSAEKLKAALVEDWNADFESYLVASASDWEELKSRTNGKTGNKFPSKETEWLVERHLGLIQLFQEHTKWEGAEKLAQLAGGSELIQLNRMFLEDAFSEDRNDPGTSAFERVDRRRFDATSSAHAIALRVVGEALDQAERAAVRLQPKSGALSTDFPKILDDFINQYEDIYKRIGRVINPAKRYIQDVLNRELAHAANSAKFDAGELLFAAASFGALTRWKENDQLAEARRLLIGLLPEDGRFQTSRPIQSNLQGLQLMPIAFEMTRCFGQLLRKDFGEDLDPKVVRKLLSLFEEHPIRLSQGDDDSIGWNFSGAPESQKPSVWVTAVGVFALDRTVRMLNERINAMVLRHFNVEWPKESDPAPARSQKSGGKLDLSGLLNTDYELQSAFKPSKEKEFVELYRKTPPRIDNVSLAIRLQQMRAHLTRAVLPTNYYNKKTTAYNAIFYGPPGTGKTTLAEALATTARVPVVRLSPSDLMVQGTDVIESRARAIFDSLSMLTRAVIFLDEFEPVVRTREIKPRKDGEPPRPQDPPEFRFLVTGMLPKLTKLNKVAARQSVVYLLATNYLSEIDDAAKRLERFDLHLPIYHPDPMSRWLVFFYGLIKVLKKRPNSDWKQSLEEYKADSEFWRRVWEAIHLTKEVSVQSLARDFFSPETSKGFFQYVLKETPRCPEPTAEDGAKLDQQTPVETDIQRQRTDYEELWKNRDPQSSRVGN